ncbi:efflux RND transporter periplasmic adaptor subunit [Vibrio sp. TRT 2004]|uniref:efflux RND transporter periplasmic adaptor subunit n=1 Tax=Vibrio sp. TRT 2004 TaxID=3418506 RepID=UPI003CE7C570
MINRKLLLGTVLFAGLALVFLYMAGVFTPKVSTQMQTRDAVSQTQPVVTLVATEERVMRQFPGTVVADQKATIAARLTATVVEVLVEVGQPVRKGDVLLRLESDDLNARVRQTEQSLSSAQAQLNAARKEYARIKELLNKKLVPQAQFDQAESTLKTAIANLEQARAAVSEAETTFGFSVITAPFDGVITHKPINSGDTATPGMALLSMYNPDSLIVEADVAESVMPALSIGATLAVEIPTYQLVLDANINEIAPAADSGSRSYLIRLGFDTEHTLYPGNFARVSVDLGSEKVLKVPVAAIYQVGQLDYVKVVEEGMVHTRLVQLGDDFRVRKGLVEGDVVLLNPRDL